MRNLFLFSDNYPYGTGETFLANEIPYLSEAYDHVFVSPLWINGNRRQTPFANVTIEDPILDFNPKKKTKLLMSGVFNTSPIINIHKELRVSNSIKDSVNCSFWKKCWNTTTSVLLTRSILSSPTFNNTVKRMTPDDLCYFYWGNTTANALPFVKKSTPGFPKCVSRLHGSDLYHEANGFIPYRNQLFDNLNMICTISQHGANYIEKLYPQTRNKTQVSRLGSGDYGTQQYFRNDVFRILTCSNIVRIKRLDLLAKALCLIDEKKVSWTHIGDGPLKEQVIDITKTFGSNIHVDFKGVMKNSDLLEFIKSSSFDVFINTSFSEGIPVSIMEAISFGIPVIATNVGGTSEIVDKNTGILIPKDITPEQLKNTILDFAKLNDDEIQQLRASTRKEWEDHWNMDNNYRRFTETITKLT